MKPKNTKRATKPAKRSTAKSPKIPTIEERKDGTRCVFPDPVPPVSTVRAVASDGSRIAVAVDSAGSVVVVHGRYATHFSSGEFSAVVLAAAQAYAKLNFDREDAP